MDYKTRRYKEGLEGKKPSISYLDEKGHRAQQAGYRDHLRNEDLAERIEQERRSSTEKDEAYERPPDKPLELWQRMVWIGLGCSAPARTGHGS
jgi:hypothetical protein